MKYYARIGDNEHIVEVEDGHLIVDGEPVAIDLEQIAEPELYSMLFDGHSYELLIEADRFDYSVTLRGEQFQVQVEDERSRKLNAGRAAVKLPDGEIAVKAPIPGLVVQILAIVDQTVVEGEPLVILEAMKMENELRCPKDGIVKKVEVEVGQRVEQNAILIVLE